MKLFIGTRAWLCDIEGAHMQIREAWPHADTAGSRGNKEQLVVTSTVWQIAQAVIGNTVGNCHARGHLTPPRDFACHELPQHHTLKSTTPCTLLP